VAPNSATQQCTMMTSHLWNSEKQSWPFALAPSSFHSSSLYTRMWYLLHFIRSLHDSGETVTSKVQCKAMVLVSWSGGQVTREDCSSANGSEWNTQDPGFRESSSPRSLLGWHSMLRHWVSHLQCHPHGQCQSQRPLSLSWTSQIETLFTLFSNEDKGPSPPTPYYQTVESPSVAHDAEFFQTNFLPNTTALVTMHQWHPQFHSEPTQKEFHHFRIDVRSIFWAPFGVKSIQVFPV
jgi:hypothetical protein